MKNASVSVEAGVLAGRWNADGSVCMFRGVPYARPPLGALRWRPPQPPEKWGGVRPAANFAPRCIQPNRPAHAVGYFGPEAESEDCLYLNVWTPALGTDEKRPVMLWLHGGAFLVGSGSLPIFDGTQLAQNGVVVVTINYRLGRLGFLAHPSLSAEQPGGASGNYGLRDQIAALHWVAANIAAFGGDPGRVTIFGQSAGSSSVNALMASPLAKGLFHRAIGQSGGAMFPEMLPLLRSAEDGGLRFARGLGAATTDELRAMPAREIQLRRPLDGERLKEIYDAADPIGIDRQTSWAIIDGTVVPDFVRKVFAAGCQNDVPLLTGSTAHEGTSQPATPSCAEFERRTRAEFGAMADAFLGLYPASTDAEAERSSRKAVGNKIFNWENWAWANVHSQTGKAPVYCYHFSHVPPKPALGVDGDMARHLGAFHTAEIPYAFKTLPARNWPWRDIDFELSDIVSGYWVNFAMTGDPNGGNLPRWPRYDRRCATVAHFDNGVSVGDVPEPEMLRFWDGVDAKLRAEIMR